MRSSTSSTVASGRELIRLQGPACPDAVVEARGARIRVLTDPARVPWPVLSTALPDGYTTGDLVRDWFIQKVYIVEALGLYGVVQFLGNRVLHLMAVAREPGGLHLSASLLRQLVSVADCSSVVCTPRSAAHARLYKRLGFTDYGDKELMWQL